MTIPEELLPVLEWWERDGKKTLAMAAVAAVVVLGYYGVKGWRESTRIAAGDALMNAESVEELESAVASYGSSASGAALKLRLAKAYYDAGSFQSAADLYVGLKGKAPKGFEEVPELGAAQCLEALGEYAQAVEAFDAFVEAYPQSPFLLSAKLGAARSLSMTGEKEKALERIAAVKKETEDNEADTALVNSIEDVIKRWEKREYVAPTAEIDEAEKALEEVAAEAPVAEAPVAEALAAEALAAEAPAAEAPAAEAPAAEAPAAEAPAAEAPAAEAPVAEAPAAN